MKAAKRGIVARLDSSPPQLCGTVTTMPLDFINPVVILLFLVVCVMAGEITVAVARKR
jgi:hypothetical protein